MGDLSVVKQLKEKAKKNVLKIGAFPAQYWFCEVDYKNHFIMKQKHNKTPFMIIRPCDLSGFSNVAI